MTESEVKQMVSQFNEQMGKIGEVLINPCGNVAIRVEGRASAEQDMAMEKFAEENQFYYDMRNPAVDHGWIDLDGFVDYEFIS